MKGSLKWVLLAICSIVFIMIVTVSTYIYLESKDKENIADNDATVVANNNHDVINQNKEAAKAVVDDVRKHIYNLTDEQIIEAIKNGKEENYTAKFLIKPTSNNGTHSIASSYLQTPAYKISTLSNVEYFHNDKTITLDYVKKNKENIYPSEKIGIITYFKNNSARLYGVMLTQDGREIANDNIDYYIEDTFKIVEYNIEDIDFDKPAELTVFDKYNNDNLVKATINFVNYVN